MDPIRPISEFEEHLHAAAQITVSQPEKSTGPSGVSGPPGFTGPIDVRRLQTDQPYLISALDYMLYRARTEYFQFRYANAQPMYEQYFRFLRYYRGGVYSPIAREYYPSVYQYMITKNVVERRSEAEKFFNAQLLEHLKPALEKKEPVFRPVLERIQQLQQQQLFPVIPESPVAVKPEVLVSLAEEFTHIQQPQVALYLLGMAEVRHMFEVSQIHRQALNLQPGTKNLPRLTELYRPKFYEHYGLPYLAGHIAEPPPLHQFASKSVELPYEVESVHMVAPIPEDPTRRQGRSPRQKRQQQNQSRKGRSARKGRVSPHITI